MGIIQSLIRIKLNLLSYDREGHSSPLKKKKPLLRKHFATSQGQHLTRYFAPHHEIGQFLQTLL